MRTLTMVLLVLYYVICAMPWQAQSVEPAAFANPPFVLNAADTVAENLLRGENYSIEDSVSSDGLINTYRLSTDYGPLTVESTAELMMRIDELNALVIMEEMDRKAVFGDALVSGVKGTVKGAAELVTHPVDGTKNLFKGTGQFVSNLGASIFSDDPDQDNVIKTALGYDVAKRKFAFEFGIDPYTDYDPVADRLGEIARAAVAGGIAPKAAMGAIDGKVVLAMRISGTAYGMMQLVRDNPPGKLREINREKLQKMGVADPLIEAFLDNYRYNPQEETLLVGELETMKGVKGMDAFISHAAQATQESVALLHRVRAQMMAGYHAHISAAASIENIDGVLCLLLKNGGLVLLAPADYVFWTQNLSAKLTSFESKIAAMKGLSGKEVWISGRFGKAARAGFEASGWKVKEDAGAVLLKSN
jgi:hypothetical protein